MRWRRLPVPLTLTFFSLGRNTAFHLKESEKQIITANSVTDFQKVSTDKKQNQMNCQHDNTWNKWYNWILCASAQILSLRTRPGKIFRSYISLSPKPAIVLFVIHVYNLIPQRPLEIGSTFDLLFNFFEFTFRAFFSVHQPKREKGRLYSSKCQFI